METDNYVEREILGQLTSIALWDHKVILLTHAEMINCIFLFKCLLFLYKSSQKA